MSSRSLRRSKFSEEVYKFVCSIPKDKVSTYKEVAEAVGSPKSVRAVGQCLKANNHPERIPCYKIVRSDGSLGGYCGSGKKNIQKKIKLLRKNGIKVVDGKVDLERCLYRSDKI